MSHRYEIFTIENSLFIVDYDKYNYNTWYKQVSSNEEILFKRLESKEEVKLDRFLRVLCKNEEEGKKTYCKLKREGYPSKEVLDAITISDEVHYEKKTTSSMHTSTHTSTKTNSYPKTFKSGSSKQILKICENWYSNTSKDTRAAARI